MSDWITDRRPTKEDADDYGYVWVSDRGKVVHTMWDCVTDEPWTHFTRPAPYAKLSYTVTPNAYRDGKWAVEYDKKLVADNIPTREAAERIASIYNEVIP